jgi:hypothetical protein
MCNNTKQRCNKCGVQVSVGEEVKVVAAAGLVLGQAGGLSVIYLHGRGRGRCSVSEEDSAGVSDGRAIRMLVHGSHGFRDGGGLIQMYTDIGIQGTAIPIRHIRDTSKQTKGG